MSIAAQRAELDELIGQGYLVVHEEGYRRCEGFFHGRLADRGRVAAMFNTTCIYRGIVYSDRTDIGARVLPVTIRAFYTNADGMVVEIQAVGRWWEQLDETG